MVDSFYRLILDQSGCYVYEYDFSDGSLPDSFTHDTLADIGLAIYHSDEPQYVPNIDKVVELLREYLDVGGKLWLVGYRNVARLVEVADTLSLFAPGQFLFEHLGLEGATSSGAYEFVGALSAAAGYETLEVDPAKLRPGKPGMMYADALAPRPEGTRVIYQFQSSDTSSTFQDQPCAMLHDRGGSSDSKVALFGFGLYQMKVDSLREPLTTLVDSLLEWFDVKPE